MTLQREKMRRGELERERGREVSKVNIKLSLVPVLS
jgi:hypothetical protein